MNISSFDCRGSHTGTCHVGK